MNILNKIKTKDGLIISSFILIEFCLWIPILIFSIKPYYPSYEHIACCLKISSIVILPVVAFILKKNEIFIGALLATIGADVFLSYIRQHNPSFDAQMVGLVFFLLVQIIFAIYFYVISKNKKRQLYITIARVVFMIIFACLALLLPKHGPKHFIMAIYAPNIILNAVCAGLEKKYFMMAGIIVYAISDLFVALGNLSINLPFSFSWLLYLPANVMLIISEDTGSYFINKRLIK